VKLNKSKEIGFTLVELIMVVVVLGIISVYAAMKAVSPADATLPSQTQKVASDIRRAQTLALTLSRRVSLAIATTGANNRYDVTCGPCGTTSNDFSTTLQKDVELTGPALYFNSLGQPSDSSSTPVSTTATYCLNISGTCAGTVSVAPLTGLVSVSP
jgi:MSHA pilin protein MshC